MISPYEIMLPPYVLLGILVSMLIVLVYCMKDRKIKEKISHIPTFYFIALALIIATCVLLSRYFLFDVHITGHAFHFMWKAKRISANLSFTPGGDLVGYPFFLSFAYYLGVSGYNLFLYNTFINILVLPVIFFSIYFYTEKPLIAIFGTALMAFYSVTLLNLNQSQPSFLFVILMGIFVLSLKFFFESEKNRFLLLSSLSLVLLANLRYESILAFLLVLPFLYRKNNRKLIWEKSHKILAVLIPTIILLSPMIYNAYLTVTGTNPGYKFGRGVIDRNLQKDINKFKSAFVSQLGPNLYGAGLIFTLLSVLGIIASLKNLDTEMGLVYLLWLGIFSSIYIIMGVNFEIEQVVIFSFPFFIFISTLFSKVKGRKSLKMLKFAVIIVLVFFMLKCSVISLQSHFYGEGEINEGGLMVEEFRKAAKGEIPKDSVVLVPDIGHAFIPERNVYTIQIKGKGENMTFYGKDLPGKLTKERIDNMDRPIFVIRSVRSPLFRGKWVQVHENRFTKLRNRFNLTVYQKYPSKMIKNGEILNFKIFRLRRG